MKHAAIVIGILFAFARGDAGRGEQPALPCPEALNAAAISVDRLDSILDYALLLGNGDVNALVYSESGALVLALTKNDVWDARLDSTLDPPLPTLDLIKRLAANDAPKHSGRSTLLEEGWGQQGEDSYHAHPHPCPRACGRLVLSDRPMRPGWREIRAQGTHNAWEHRDGAVDLQDLAAATSPARLDLRRAVARVAGAPESVPKAEIRALADRNVLLIKSPAQAGLVPLMSPDIPAAGSGEEQGVAWDHLGSITEQSQEKELEQ